MKPFDAHALVAAINGKRDYACPKGWSTVEDIRKELNLAHTRNASSRAYDLHKQGLLERLAHQFKAKTGQCHYSYVYRPIKPYRTITEAADNRFAAREDKVPSGWVRVVDFAAEIGLSHVAVRSRIERARVKPKYFKTSRGVSGLHLNAYYRKADLGRLLRKAP
jgi:hypothetical protein